MPRGTKSPSTSKPEAHVQNIGQDISKYNLTNETHLNNFRVDSLIIFTPPSPLNTSTSTSGKEKFLYYIFLLCREVKGTG